MTYSGGVPKGRINADLPAPDPDNVRQVDAVMAAARVLIAVVARSVAEVGAELSVPQLRVLVVVATRGPQNLSAVAEALGFHPSNATRTVERLVSAGFLDRRDAPDDRRNVRLTLTKKGQRLVDSVFERRRAAIEQVVARMPESRRRALPAALESFAEAAGEAPEDHFGDMQWAH